MNDFDLPYLINYAQPAAEQIAIFCVAVLTAIIVSAEGQGFAATLLGDSQMGNKERFHFNVFMHMSLLGTLSFFIAGFGWTKKVTIDASNFKSHPRVRLIASRLAGPIANLLMANIGASLSWILERWGFDDQVFSTIVVVNVTMAIYGLIMIPPLPGGSILLALFPSGQLFNKVRQVLCTVGPYLLLGSFLAVRLSGWDGLSSFFNPIVSATASLLLGIE